MKMHKFTEKVIGKLKKLGNFREKNTIFDDDVWLVSYPKSGSSWLRFLIGNYISDNKCDFTNTHSIIPDIHYKKIPRNLKRPRFIKSHLPFTRNYKKVVYLVRDGRDCAVSYYFHCIRKGQISQDMKFSDFLIKFNDGSLDKFKNWNTHVNSWLNKGKKKDQTFLLVRYEEMKHNPLAKLTQILEFAGLSVDIEAATRSVEQSEFEKMKKLRENQTDKLAFPDKNPITSSIRKGEVGDYKNFFNDELLEKCTKVHGSGLRRLGYF